MINHTEAVLILSQLVQVRWAAWDKRDLTLIWAGTVLVFVFKLKLSFRYGYLLNKALSRPIGLFLIPDTTGVARDMMCT